MTDLTEVPAKSRQGYGVPSFVVALVAAVLYAYVLWQAIGNIVQLPKVLGSVTPWWLLILDVALPFVVYVAALLLGRRHGTLARSAFFAIGATVLACCTVGSIAFVQTH